MATNVIEFAATGRRKEAVARARLIPGEGNIKVNGLDIKDYFHTETVVNAALEPMALTDTLKKFDVICKVRGGGKVGQAGAMRHALSRALVMSDEELKSIIKSKGMLTRDARMKERKKPGQPGARARFQFSKR